MNKYEVVVYLAEYEDGTSEWCAKFPDVRGVGGGGATAEEAVRDAYDNLAVHLEEMQKLGMKLPEATNPYEGEYSGKFSVRISKTLHRKAAMAAKQEGVSLNAFVAEAIAQRA